MRKVLILTLFFAILFAKEENTMNYKKYENYINDILNYKVELEPLSYNPFYIPIQKKREEKEKITKKQSVKTYPKPSIKILTILNNKAYLLLKDRGKTKKAWVSIGEKLGDFKLIKILKEAVLVKYKNRFKIVRLNKKIENFKLKVTQ